MKEPIAEVTLPLVRKAPQLVKLQGFRLLDIKYGWP
jgi:hypothetical protein